MAPHRLKPLYVIILIASFFLTPVNSFAQSQLSNIYASNFRQNTGADMPVVNPTVALAKSFITETRNVKSGTLAEQQRLMGYLKTLHINADQKLAQPNKKFYYQLAGIFARLKLYPLAMKCYLKSIQHGDGQLTVDSTESDTGPLNVSTGDDAVVVGRASAKIQPANPKSGCISRQKIVDSFNDGKLAVAYALLFHVKQPVPGKRKIFVWGNTGHTFVTLIKYNIDSTVVSASFGFYPEKEQFLSATPLIPTTSSTFKDDAGHGWDEVIGKFISKQKFEKILKLTEDFDGITYNLNNRNCTDFGLQAAGLAGITIWDTAGKWPLGSGNNPAITGQSILMGKFGGAGQNLFSTDLVRN